MKSNEKNIDFEVQTEEKVNVKEIFSAMQVYLNEFIHRNTHMWSQTYRFFFFSLIVMLLPLLTERIGISIPDKLAAYYKIFSASGILLAFAFLYITLALAKRIAAVSKTYNNLIQLLPSELRRIKLETMPGKMLDYSQNYVVIVCMFVVLVALGTILTLFIY